MDIKSGWGLKWFLVLFALVACLITGCTDSRPVLYLYNWSDYMDPEIVKEFEEEYGCRVILDTFDSNEAMYTKLKTGGGQYDLVVPTSYMSRNMWEEGMIQPIDPDKVPNRKNVDPVYLGRFSIDKEMKYSVPYMLGTTGLAYRKDVLGENVEDTWAILEDDRLKGRVVILNDMREVIGAALKYLGCSLNTTNPEELQKAAEVLVKWRGNLAKFDSEQYKSGLASGEFYLVQGYSGDILQVMEEVDGIGFMLPREGFAMGVDDMVIPKNARSPDLAHAFINFLHRPEIAARNMEFTMFFSPNLPAYDLVSEELRNNPMVFIPAEKMQRGEIIDDVGESLPRYSRIWDQVRRGR